MFRACYIDDPPGFGSWVAVLGSRFFLGDEGQHFSCTPARVAMHSPHHTTSPGVDESPLGCCQRSLGVDDVHKGRVHLQKRRRKVEPPGGVDRRLVFDPHASTSSSLQVVHVGDGTATEHGTPYGALSRLFHILHDEDVSMQAARRSPCLAHTQQVPHVRSIVLHDLVLNVHALAFQRCLHRLPEEAIGAAAGLVVLAVSELVAEAFEQDRTVSQLC